MQQSAKKIRGLSRDELARRVAQEVEDGWVVNLGIGMPNEIVPHVPAGRDVVFHSENGIIGIGPPPDDPDFVDDDMQTPSRLNVTLIPGGSFVSASDSFLIARSGRLDLAILGSFQVAENGDLANWKVPGPRIGNVGGAMDIAAGAQRVYAMMTHTTRDGESKVVTSVSYPVTARGVVTKVFTDLAVIRVTPDGLVLDEVAPGLGPDDVQQVTGPTLKVTQGGVKTIRV